MLSNNKLLNLFYIFVISPILFTMATNRFPEEYKKYVIYLVIFILAYHIYRFFSYEMEGMESICGSNIHYIQMFDSLPGYDKPSIKIKSGDVVIWTNVGEIEHTVTSDDSLFNSGIMRPGENYVVSFSKPGTYPYSCMYHTGWMSGVIHVE